MMAQGVYAAHSPDRPFIHAVPLMLVLVHSLHVDTFHAHELERPGGGGDVADVRLPTNRYKLSRTLNERAFLCVLTV